MENNILFIEAVYKYKYYYGYVTENIFKILDSKLEIKETVFTEMLKTGVFKIRNTEKTKIDKKIKIC
jgi:hypothetical protein